MCYNKDTMKATVRGLIYLRSGNWLDVAFHKQCNSLKEILEAVELAFDEGAVTVTIQREVKTELQYGSESKEGKT